MIYTTLNKIRAHGPCDDGWRKLLKYLGKTEADDEPLPMVTILDSNGLNDCLWCCCTLPEYDKEWRMFAVWCARQVQHHMKDPRSIAALDVAERYANGNATKNELLEARTAAREAALEAAREAGADLAAWAAGAALEADLVAWAAGADLAAWAAGAAWADLSATRDEQEKELRRVLTEGGE